MGPTTNRAENQTPDSVSLAADIVTAIADRTGIDPLELPSLHDAVDAECLADYLEYDQDGQDVAFPYAGYCVTVTAAGAVTAVPLSAIASPASIASRLADSTAVDTSRGWQWEPFGGYHSTQYDRGAGERTLVYGEHGEGDWIESDDAVPVET
ncbi:HalOD1 output domain-containing protein [Haloarcula salinisoli]|uniref:Halobacterial output domain-containing protein n=1 Tax=Haloarcula salinisoli TaxID=2487746 RepID=A0A8J8C997_9EURY|nr:HalOD1 output domain-containing protein [Halomicroarcula salinisoli]MBX0286678.1 hypothetical protein [Halomicroarcula salinisoli]MBX0303989.1 hypothetical protein [Halomicroarcula salinisoli]